MQIELSEEQAVFHGALDKLLSKYRQAPTHDATYVHYSPELQTELTESGFLGIALQEGYGPLDAALMAESAARLPLSVEVAASALLSHCLAREFDGPVALCEAIGRPTRYLSHAKYACIRTSSGFSLAELRDGDVRAVESVLAYPIGILTAMPAGAVALNDDSAKIRSLWQIAIAAEAAGLMRGAFDLTVRYVKDRRQFNQPLGDFQSIQHRLAIDEQIISASYLLAMRAAHSLRPEDAATAALYVQQHMRTVIYDCHQFTGAMGVTLEYPLHLWTYRLKFIQGELGGYTAQAAALADLVWPEKQRA